MVLNQDKFLIDTYYRQLFKLNIKGTRLSFADNLVDAHFWSDDMIQHSGFVIDVISGYEPENEIATSGFARIISAEEMAERRASAEKKTQ